MTNDLVNAYINYVGKRSIIRQRQRQELQNELKPVLKAFGKAIIDAQKNGKRIEDIEFVIGTKNRTLIYNAKRAAKGIESPDVPEPLPTPENPSESRWRVIGTDPLDDGYEFIVEIDHKTHNIVVEDGIITLPDHWAADVENQALYREIVAHIKTQV